jgi:hypothetical protein
MVPVFTSSKEDMQLTSGFATSTSPRVPPRNNKNNNNIRKRKLPQNFLPSPYAVICGRGKACSSSPGNKNLRRIINSYLTSYSEARKKREKSAIVSSIVGSIKQAAPNGALFCKFEGGCWWEVEDGVAREKVGCLLRDSLHTQYRSSTKAKLARRHAKNKLMTATGGVAGDELGLNGSSSNHSSYAGHSISSINSSNHSRISCSSYNSSYSSELSWNGSSNHSSYAGHSISSINSSNKNSRSYSSYNPSYSSADINSSNSSLFSSDAVEESVEPKQQEPSSYYVPMIQDLYANCSLQQQQQQQNLVVRSNIFHMFRDLSMPIMTSSHLDMMGGSGARKGGDILASFNMVLEEEQCNSRSLPRVLHQACDILASFQDDVDLPDDISDIFD